MSKMMKSNGSTTQFEAPDVMGSREGYIKFNVFDTQSCKFKTTIGWKNA